MSANITSEVLIRIVPMAVLAGGFAIGLELLKIKLERKIREKRGETTPERIERLSKALKESIELTSEIEREIQTRHSMVVKLSEDVARYEELAKLKESEIEAVAQALRGELRTEGAKSLIRSAVISFMFFVAGVVVTLFAS